MALPQRTAPAQETPTSHRTSNTGSGCSKELSPVQNAHRYFPFDDVISEKNLTYVTSLIEVGHLQKDQSGRGYWVTKLQKAPDWLDENNVKRKSPSTGRPMQDLPFLPENIDVNVPAWELTLWFRYAADQNILITQKDIFDRMRANALTHSGLSSRMQTWQRGVGMLPSTVAMVHNWPSKTSMETISQLSHLQLKLNTWWDVENVSEQQTYKITQPAEHIGYRERYQEPPIAQSYYLLDHPEERQMSEQVELLYDAMLFLTIKAEESEDPDGFDGIMQWIAHPPPDNQHAPERAITLVQEFQRWGRGCPETPSVDMLRVALDYAQLPEEHSAIMRADYSLTLWLQDVVGGLAHLREARRLEDRRTRSEMTSKKEAKKHKKRKGDEVDGVENTNASKK